MRVTSGTSSQPNLWDTDRSTSSPESACGPSHSGSQASPTTPKSGPPPAHASLSARQAGERGLLTSGTYGLRPSTSSGTAVPESSWESRLQALTASLGSTLYSLTWKRRVTPAGRSICALRASARRTSDNGSTGWPTPVANPANGTPEAFLNRKRKAVAKGSSMGICLSDINMVAQLATWPTPCQQDGPKGGPSQGIDRLPACAAMTGWPTANVADSRNSRNLTAGRTDLSKPFNPGMTLCDAVTLAGWATPTASEKIRSEEFGEGRQPNARECLPTEGPARRTASGETLTGSSAAMPSGGRLSPAHSLWLQLGPFATAWLNSAERVTRSTSRKPKRSSGQTST